MSPSSPILITIDSNEAARPRADLIRKAIETDDRFCLSNGRLDTPFDIRFVSIPIGFSSSLQHSWNS